ncbi:MAG: formyltransferase family protein [Myxococcota bacterium]
MAPRVVYFGMDSEFSTRPLLGLLESGVRVLAVVKPIGGIAMRKTNVATRYPSLMTRIRERLDNLLKPGPSSPLVAWDAPQVPDDPFTIAEASGIPCIVVGDASGDRAVRLLRRFDADVYCVAFFNQLLRRRVLALPRLGAVNLHPSLLPAYRGPSPLFWMFRDAPAETGVTLHLLSPGEDDGDVLAQARVPLTDGMRGPELVHTMALLGKELMVKGVWDLYRGEETRKAQDGARAFRSPRPQPEDLRVDFRRPARDVFNFVRGVSSWVPLYAQVGMDRLEIQDAQAFEPGVKLPGEFSLSGNILMAQCLDGTVVLRIRSRGWTGAV